MTALVVAACSPGTPRHAARPVLTSRARVAADTGPARALPVVAPPRAHVWLARVGATPRADGGEGVSTDPAGRAVARAPLPSPALPEPVAPELPDTSRGPALVVEAGLLPPLLSSADPLRGPRGRAAGGVELDLRVDASGEVGEARWAGGSRDTVLVQAALACARSMRFLPATRGGVHVPVWCRERFDFPRR
jgi:TonB family protein